MQREKTSSYRILERKGKKERIEIIELKKLWKVWNAIVATSTFLDASKHLYMRVCPSVRRSVGPSVWNAFFNLAETLSPPQFEDRNDHRNVPDEKS